MSVTSAWWKTVAGLSLTVISAGVVLANDPPSPTYDLSPTPSSPQGIPVSSTSATCDAYASPVESTYATGAHWTRINSRRWERKRRLQDKCLGYPEEFCEQPLGAALYSQMSAQAANGMAAKLVLYHYDFVDGSPNLKVYGHERLAKHIASMNFNAFPLLIEPTPDEPELADARRVAVQQAMLQMQASVDVNRVIVGIPTPVALPGRQAQLLDINLMRDTRNGGTSNLAPGSFRAGGSFQGAGFGGGNYGNLGMGGTQR